MTQRIALQSTGQEVYEMPWAAQSPRPWRDGYSRVVIPYLDKNGEKRGHIQIVHNTKLKNLTTA